MGQIIDTSGNVIGSEVGDDEGGKEPSAGETVAETVAEALPTEAVAKSSEDPPKRIHVITPPARPPRSITVLIDQDRLGFGMLGDVSVEDMRGAAAGLMKAAEQAMRQQAEQAKAAFDARMLRNMPGRKTV